MWYAAVIRFIRRRLVLGIIFASSLTYCIVSFLREGGNRNMVYQDIMIERKPFVWRTLQEHNETSDNMSCRNSVQGKLFIVDDRGSKNGSNANSLYAPHPVTGNPAFVQILVWPVYLECF